MPDVETTLDGSTLVVRIPMRLQCRGVRKRIVAPDGSAIVPAGYAIGLDMCIHGTEDRRDGPHSR